MNHEWLKKSCKFCLSFRPCIYFNFGFFFICSHLGFSVSYSTLLCFQVVVIVVVVLGFICYCFCYCYYCCGQYVNDSSINFTDIIIFTTSYYVLILIILVLLLLFLVLYFYITINENKV